MSYLSPAGLKVSFNCRLVRSVEKHPNIYNYELKEYLSRAHKQKSWRIIAAELGSTEALCKEKWRNLRICYTEYIRKYPNDSLEQLVRRSYLTEVMHFLRPFIRTRGHFNHTSSFDEDTSDIPSDISEIISSKLEYFDDTQIISDEETNDDELITPTLSENIHKDEFDILPSQYVEIQNRYNSSEQLPDLTGPGNTILLNSNPRHQFLMSILPDLEKMNDRQMRKFRAKLSTAIEEILED